MNMIKTVLRVLIITIAVAVFLAFPNSSNADQIGDSQSFFTDTNYDSMARTRVPGSLRLITEHAYFYIEDSLWLRMSASAQNAYISLLTDVGNDFDAITYDRETQAFGHETNPGIDNDPRITIFLTQLKPGVGGYFNDTNELPQSEVANSNEREMLYIATSIVDRRRLDFYIAHEFNHMITYNEKQSTHGVIEDTWLNELRAEYAITVAGYNDQFDGSNLQKRLGAFLTTPSDPLIQWDNISADYGQIGLFGEYLAEQFGPDFVEQTARTGRAGIDSVNEVLASRGLHESIDDVYGAWLAANVINETSHDGRLGYTRSDLKGFRVPSTYLAFQNDSNSLSTSVTMGQYQGAWLRYGNLVPSADNVIQFTFDSPDLSHLRVAYVTLDTFGVPTFKQIDINPSDPRLLVYDAGASAAAVILMPFRRPSSQGNFSGPVPVHIDAKKIAPKINDIHEGDFIRAYGDKDVYVVNAYGFKRLIISPAICALYGHLQSRGCFAAVKEVSSEVRDSFATSWYLTNGETNDDVVYRLDPIGTDYGRLVRVAQTPDEKTFFFNSRENKIYAQ